METCSLLNDSQIIWCPAPEFLKLEANSYSFSIPKYKNQPENGEEFKKIFVLLTKCLEEHVRNANILITTNKNLSERVEVFLFFKNLNLKKGVVTCCNWAYSIIA
jgi:predicted secreted protein